MALKTLVKVGKVSNLSDARYCAGMGADMLGFSVNPGSEHFVSQPLFKEIRGWFSGPLVVAEVFGLTTQEEFIDTVNNYAPDLIEMSIHELRFVQPNYPKCILSITLEEWDHYQTDILSAKNQIEYVLVPAISHTSIFTKISEQFKVLVQLDASSNLQELLDNARISGISLQGSLEERPGFKSYDQLTEIFEQLEVQD